MVFHKEKNLKYKDFFYSIYIFRAPSSSSGVHGLKKNKELNLFDKKTNCLFWLCVREGMNEISDEFSSGHV